MCVCCVRTRMASESGGLSACFLLLYYYYTGRATINLDHSYCCRFRYKAKGIRRARALCVCIGRSIEPSKRERRMRVFHAAFSHRDARDAEREMKRNQ